jgi:cell division protein FtsI/penicillin-binding protein 2
VDGWLNPWPEAADRSFQIVQSLLAFGAGGIFGRGLGLGNPTYIPAVHTDFNFAAVAEEFGLAGALLVIALYGLLLLRGFRTATNAMRPFERLLAAGLTSGLVIQAWVIMAGNARLTPIAGVTLPFVSYGGSSILTSFVALGLLLRVSGSTTETQSLWAPPTKLSSQPYFQLAVILSVALILLAMICGYWTAVRADSLSARDDNPRRVLYEQRIVRGHIIDRDGVVLADAQVTNDDTVSREYPVPEAAPAVGYASLRYGTGGIEAAFDPELRGEAGRSSWEAAWEELLHRSPQGRDVQLTLDATLQIQAQQALKDQAGAVVLLDASNGEILALASSPIFDPALLDETWEELSENPTAPLVNRATQGLYQPGAALQTIIIAEVLNERLADLADLVSNADETLSVNGTQLGCSGTLSEPHTLAATYAAACPAPVATLAGRMEANALREAIEGWSLDTPPVLEIPAESVDWDSRNLVTIAGRREEAIGQGTLTVSPLQMVLVAGTLANEGKMPAPRLVLQLQDEEGIWQAPPSEGEPRAVLTPDIVHALLAVWPRYGDGQSTAGSALALRPDVAGYLGLAVAGEEQSPHAWFLGVAPADTPRYAVAVLLEHPDEAESAITVGVALLQSVSAD